MRARWRAPWSSSTAHDEPSTAGATTTETLARRQDLTNLEHTLRAELRAEMAELRGDMRTEFAAVRTEMTTAMRTQLFAMIGAMFTLAALTWAAASIA